MRSAATASRWGTTPAPLNVWISIIDDPAYWAAAASLQRRRA
jgi:hypothetical protein